MLCVFKCPHCNSNMKYDIMEQKLRCESCASELDIDDFDKDRIIFEGKIEIKDDLQKMNCPGCGANIITSVTNAKVNCCYCNTELALFGTAAGEISPELIIRTKITEQEARNQVIKWWMNNESLPSYDVNKIKLSFEHVYIPVWLSDIEAVTNIVGEISWEQIKGAQYNNYAGVSEENKALLYQAGIGNRNIVKVERTIEKGENPVVRKSLNVGKIIQSVFKKLPINGSSHFSTNKFKAIEPYNYSELEEFNPTYLMGYRAENPDMTKEEATSLSMNDAKKYGSKQAKDFMAAEGGVAGSLDKVYQEKTSAHPKGIYYGLLPLWICSYKYKNQRHYIYVNGQTGKTDGELYANDESIKRELAFHGLSNMTFYLGLILLCLSIYLDYAGNLYLIFVILLFLLLYKFGSSGKLSVLGTSKRQIDDFKPNVEVGSFFSSGMKNILRIIAGVSLGVLGSLFSMKIGKISDLIFNIPISIAAAIVISLISLYFFYVKRSKELAKNRGAEYNDYIPECGTVVLETKRLS